MEDKISFRDALKFLRIEEYHDRIINSNSHGELFHLQDYFKLAEMMKDGEEKDILWFKEYFEGLVKYANENWERPSSVYQHVITNLEANFK